MKTQVVIAFAVGFWMSSSAYSQGMCIPPALKAHDLQGHVVWKSDGKPMAGIDVELLSFDQKMTRLAGTKTDALGFFEITRPEPGRYWLRAKNDQIPGLTVEIRIEGKTAPRGSKQDDLRFLLGLDPQKYCWGSSVSVVREARSAPK